MITISHKKGEGIMQWSIAWAFIGLFFIAIIGFSLGFASDNNTPISIADDQEVLSTYGNITENIGGFQENAGETLNSTLTSTISPSAASGTTATSGQYSLTLGNLYGVAKNSLLLGYSKIFGSDSGFGIFITTFLSIVVFIFTFYIIKAWIGRTPD